MQNVRAVFKKRGMVRFTSHLDNMRIFTRALCRSGLPVYFTEGFNPHPYIVLALPLSLGFESECDICDFRLLSEHKAEKIMQKINLFLPQGIEIVSVSSSVTPIKNIRYAEYQTQIFGDMPFSADDFKKIGRYFQKESIIVEKKSKKGFREINIKDFISELSFSLSDGVIIMNSRLAAGEDGLNPEVLIKCIRDEIEKPVYPIHRRIAILNENYENFL